MRVSLGGVHDEAEIRGHRRTYIGSMPGRVIQSMRKAKTSNPLFLLDEVDKMGADFRGDPSSALLEVLDPEQNHTFNDHYLEVDYDLSSVMFITTANTLNIPPSLMDRMEIIRIAGYTEDEKVEIARKHLIPDVTTKHGLDATEWAIDDEALLTIIRRYTREAGVRNLERELSTLVRKAVKELILSEKKSVKASANNLAEYLGVPKYRYGEVEGKDLIGIVTGLAWTDVGGELLTIEAAIMPGKGRMTVTGNLRDVMKEFDLGGGGLRALARGRLRHRTAVVRQARHPRPRAGRRDAEGWTVGGRRHGHGDRLGDDRHPGAPRSRHDWRDHAARPRVADRRSQGEAARGLAWGHQDGAHSRRERQGSCRNRGQHQEWARDRSGLAHGRGARSRDDAQAGADRVGRDHDHRNGRARGGPGRGGSLDAHRALNDRDTGAEAAVTSQNFIHSSSWAQGSMRERSAHKKRAHKKRDSHADPQIDACSGRSA